MFLFTFIFRIAVSIENNIPSGIILSTKQGPHWSYNSERSHSCRAAGPKDWELFKTPGPRPKLPVSDRRTGGSFEHWYIISKYQTYSILTPWPPHMPHRVAAPQPYSCTARCSPQPAHLKHITCI